MAICLPCQENPLNTQPASVLNIVRIHYSNERNEVSTFFSQKKNVQAIHGEYLKRNYIFKRIFKVFYFSFPDFVIAAG